MHVANNPAPPPTAWQLFRIWSTIGLQSFGGGASTSFLIQTTFIDKYRLMSMEDYIYYWNLCVMTPGINLIALTVLIGHKLRGTRGIIASLSGMLIPSALITCLLTAGFQLIQSIPAVQAILRGIIPATAGIMLVVGLRFAQPQFQQAYKEGFLRLGFTIVIITACALAIALLKFPVIPVLLASALLGMVCFTSSWRAAAPLPVENKIEDDSHD